MSEQELDDQRIVNGTEARRGQVRSINNAIFFLEITSVSPTPFRLQSS